MPPAYFEDFTVGQTFASRAEAMERGRLIAFGQEFDPQPQHLGEAEAAASNFGALVASGWHTAALTMRLFTEALPPIAGGGQGLAVEELSWPNPVRAGDEIHAEIEILALRESRSRPGKGIVRLRCLTKNQRGEVVQTAVHTMMAPRRPAAAPPTSAGSAPPPTP